MVDSGILNFSFPTMLINFSFANHKSFRKDTTFSMVASKVLSHREENTFTADANTTLLKTTCIYGPNASGKSNLINGLSFMRSLILDSHKANSKSKINVVPFIQTGRQRKAGSSFEVTFVKNSKKYIYGFVASRDAVLEEWLTYYPKTHPVELFTRKKGEIKLGRTLTGLKKYLGDTRDNALFLQVADHWDNEYAKEVFNWFSDDLRILINNSGVEKESNTAELTQKYLQDKNYAPRILKILQVADPSIKDVEIATVPVNLNFDKAPQKIIEALTLLQFPFDEEKTVMLPTFLHESPNPGDGKPQYLPIAYESSGTRKLFDLAGLIINTLDNGGTLLVDEVDNELHPKITRYLVEIFQRKDSNPNNAQLITSTHTTNLLNTAHLRKDQIWFTEKDKTNSTVLYSLDRIKKANKSEVRSDTPHEDPYLDGRYGATPILQDSDYNLGVEINEQKKV